MYPFGRDHGPDPDPQRPLILSWGSLTFHYRKWIRAAIRRNLFRRKSLVFCKTIGIAALLSGTSSE